MRKTFLALAALALPLLASAADNSPIGRWKTLDDETGKVMTIAEVYQAQNGKLAAKIVEAVDPSAATCTKCDGAKKGKSTVGMPILWNLSPVNGGWGGGEGYKPSAGMGFKAKSVKLVDGGNKLEVTGCKLFICKTATWVRVH
ncbi:DUF2147 domain-containing protein [Cognatilysobacter segetis]|uniref:DUF2147 domain-containing protein n=1 Tax=Cognatilysobacter segetis TaxID=2492394 RepID=UPI001060F36B|nr:DUF2147 domain-containing protein [Lysobacter segetis]